MLKKTLIAIAALGVAGTTFAADRVFIPFADRGGIDDFHPVNDHVVYLRGRTQQWYKAEMFAPCSGLNFSERIGYETEADGSFDDTSSIIVDGQKCRVQKLEKSEDPNKLPKDKR